MRSRQEDKNTTCLRRDCWCSQVIDSERLPAARRFLEQDIQEYYSKLAPVYSLTYRTSSTSSLSTVSLVREAENAILDIVAHDIEPGICLDLGCGTGHHSRLIASTFNELKVLGIDHSPSMLKTCLDFAKRSTYPDRQCFLLAPIQLLPIHDQTISMAMCFFGPLNHVRHFSRAINEIFRVLKPGGVVVFSVLNRWRVLRLLRYALRGKVRWIVEAFRDQDSCLVSKTGDPLRVWTHYYGRYQIRKSLLSEGFTEIKTGGQFWLISPVYEGEQEIGRLTECYRRIANCLEQKLRWGFCVSSVADLIYIVAHKPR